MMVTKLKKLTYKYNSNSSGDTLCLRNLHIETGYVIKQKINDALEKYKKEDLSLDECKVNDLTVTKISRKSWKASYYKWWLLVIMARLHIRFHLKDGFSYLKVVGKCGYCKELDSNCPECYLYNKGVCCSLKYLTNERRKNMAFWKYVRRMRKDIRNYSVKINWKKEILPYAIEMRDSIKRDRPIRASLKPQSSLVYIYSLFNNILSICTFIKNKTTTQLDRV